MNAAMNAAMNTAPACARTDCSGRIRDGYCDRCGHAPGPAASRPTAGTAPPSRPSPHPTSSSASSPVSARVPWGTLGAGLVDIPPVPLRDPASAVLADPHVPEHKRFCGSCDAEVGRGRDGRPGRPEGYCPRCGTRFRFTPALARGDLVAAQYEVLGCLAHGGTGWVYLARDREVSGRWVALKGLLGTGDPDLLAAAAAERRFLAAVEHPNIVRIHNFVQHFGAGYIVMEYVGGRSLKEIVLERRRAGESPPLAHVLAYGLEALRALGHLHDLGLLYCDFKPDNAIHTGDQLKLIDLGGVRRAGDPDGPVYGTVGYQAPEIAERGPSIGSDLYTVARTMAVLSFEFTGFTGKYRESLPDRDRVQILKRYGSYDRLLRRGAHPDPAERFGSAAEMAEQVAGVLHEVLAGGGRPRPPFPGRFEPGPPPAVAGPGVLPGAAWVADALPAPLLDDPGPAGDGLRSAAGLIARGEHEPAQRLLAGLAGDWRAAWYLGISALKAGEVATAERHFDRVHGLVPGETPPKLALGLCAELRGDHAAAARHHEPAWRAGGYVSAAFGLARARFAEGDRAGAMEALAAVPAASGHHADAQAAMIVAALAGRDPAGVGSRELAEAAERLENLGLPAARHHRLAVFVLDAALRRLRARPHAPSPAGGGTEILGVQLTEPGLRQGLERHYRALARLAGSRPERVALVELANAARPRTVV
ncbi:tetratricopeptide repeat protein [Actinomadura viridis]|uniref:non-specific serine/threonine protein kinase n=1 Tax=Actinomadura viridis TaxID=58110 RepID=A0A931GKQ7_9ACTN|nr:tetratricopeptide repeat protein [Actinomadura viridis]MBG6091143.1 serine/threonine-protein kinase PknG [Actinomadura viridis]